MGHFLQLLTQQFEDVSFSHGIFFSLLFRLESLTRGRRQPTFIAPYSKDLLILTLLTGKTREAVLKRGTQGINNLYDILKNTVTKSTTSPKTETHQTKKLQLSRQRRN